MAFIKLPEEILDSDLSAAEIRIIANLIKYSFDDNKCYIGYIKLAESCHMTKAHVINLVKELQRKGLLTITPRGNFSRSNEILLTFGDLVRDPVGGRGSQNEGYNNYTSKGYNNYTSKGYNNYTEGYNNYTPHIDKRFKYSDLNLKNGAGYKNYTPNTKQKNIEPAGAAAGNSFVDFEQAKYVGAELSPAAKDIISFFELHYPSFQSWYKLTEENGSFHVYPVTPFVGRIIPEPEQIKNIPDGVTLHAESLQEVSQKNIIF